MDDFILYIAGTLIGIVIGYAVTSSAIVKQANIEIAKAIDCMEESGNKELCTNLLVD